MGKKKTPAINSSSTADIAFLLLCYFLMTTTMGSQNGLSRLLPPMPDKEQQQDQKINRRNIIVVKINSADRLFAGSEPILVSQLKDKIVEFLTNPAGNPNLPEREDVDIEGYGKYPVSKGVISLQNDRGTSYAAYIAVQNELVKAINQLRDEFCNKTWGRDYALCDQDQQAIAKKAIPQKISEAEPKDVSGRK